jgi:hypothetical protein
MRSTHSRTPFENPFGSNAMTRRVAWLVGSVVLVPALLAWGADGNAGGSSERHFSQAEINAYIAWTQGQRAQVLQLVQARAAQIKPLQEQVRQLQEQMKPLLAQMREINEQFEQNLTALSTPDQVAAAEERIRHHGWASSQPAGEATRHHEWASSQPAGEAARHHEWASSRPAGEGTRGHAWATSGPADDANRRHKLELEKQHLQHEINHLNHELKDQH